MGKRLFDIAAALVLLTVSLPVMLLAALAIKLEGSGPILFRQQRIGLGERPFWLLKFRTMVVGAEDQQEALLHLNQMDGPVFKIKGDPRLTRVGRLLRKFQIDELPQLFNVLEGTMSMVGPRPLSQRDYNLINENWVRRRFTVKQGITCLWQVIPNHNSLSVREWMELDMDYIDRQNLWLDLRICLQTILTILSGKGI